MHGLSIRGDGFVEMAYIGKVPWHHMGNPMTAKSTKDDWRKASGYDHDILAKPVEYTVDDETLTIIDRMVMYRSDNHYPLGVVSKDYKIVQPRDVLDFFDDLIQSVGMTMETAGTLFSGRQYWVLVKIGEGAVLGSDAIKGFLLLSTSADGSRKTVAKATSMRVECNNMLCMSDNPRFNTGGSVTVSHRSQFDGDAIKRALGVAPTTFKAFMASFDVLAKKRVAVPRALELTEQVFGKDAHAVPKVMTLFNGEAIGYDAKGFAGTAWGLLNCCTEYVDHGTRASSDSHRINNSLFGRGDERKRKAYDLVMAYAS